MTAQAMDRFEGLAASDASLAPLARLHQVIVQADGTGAWNDAARSFELRPVTEAPLLHGEALSVPRGDLERLWVKLLEVAAGDTPSPRLDPATIDVVDVVEASICNDLPSLERLAAEAGVEAGFLATLANLAGAPLLLAWARQAAPALEAAEWSHGYCPLCAAWPALAELRGLDRERWLRCARCGTGWRFPLHTCAYCGNNDHRTLSYLAADEERDTRRAEVCQRCGSYLKTLATLGPLTIEDILLQDMITLELDLAAIDQEYGRPDQPGFALRVTVRAES